MNIFNELKLKRMYRMYTESIPSLEVSTPDAIVDKYNAQYRRAYYFPSKLEILKQCVHDLGDNGWGYSVQFFKDGKRMILVKREVDVFRKKMFSKERVWVLKELGNKTEKFL